MAHVLESSFHVIFLHSNLLTGRRSRFQPIYPILYDVNSNNDLPLPEQDGASRDKAVSLLCADAQGSLLAFILSLVGSYEDARDILQETNLVIWNKRHQFEVGTSFWAWACTIARFQVMAFRKQQSRSNLHLSDEAIQLIAEDASHIMSKHEDRAEALELCLSQLPASHSQLIGLRYQQGLPVAQVAKAVQRSTNSVTVKLHRIRQALADCIERKLAHLK